jgi:hypothetical protein
MAQNTMVRSQATEPTSGRAQRSRVVTICLGDSKDGSIARHSHSVWYIISQDEMPLLQREWITVTGLQCEQIDVNIKSKCSC